MEIISGEEIAAAILDGLRTSVPALGYKPIFCDLLLGNDERSMLYVTKKGAAADSIGIEFRFAHLSEETSVEEVVRTLEAYSREDRMRGIIVQLPLPKHFSAEDRRRILDAIDPRLDVDCLGTANMKKFYSGDFSLIPPTAGAVLHLLDTVPVDLAKSELLVIGQGDLVGRPVTHLLRSRGLRVRTADIQTSEEALRGYLRTADVIISGTGQHNLFTGENVKQGVVILDAGTTKFGGDLDQKSLAGKPSYLSPVPGGVGPVTVAMLMQNVVKVAQANAA